MTEWRWPNFIPAEFICPCCKEQKMEPEFLDRLQALRTAYGKPIPITSGYRCPKHNGRVSDTGETGPHTTGRAVDIGARGGDAVSLLREALKLGFTGFGIDQKGPTRFIHLDDLPGGYPRPNIWSY